MKNAEIMIDEEATYVLLGIESQKEIHYAMPIRTMEYDALQYAKQVESIAKKHREAHDFKGHGRGEYLSGFFKEDRVTPVITLVIHFGAETWDGPRSLHEMLSVKKTEILAFVQNYRIHLIEPSSISEEDFKKFTTSLKQVMEFIKYSKDKKKLSELLEYDEGFRAIDRNAALVISECTNSGFHFEEGKETIDMCQALQEIRKEAAEFGRQEGMLEMIGRLALAGKLNGREALEECRILGYREEDLRAMMDRLRKR